MQKKPTSKTTTGTRDAEAAPTSADVRERLAQPLPRLAADEEKGLRMLHGASLARTTVLERVGQDHPEARAKLLGIELELLRQLKARQAAAAAAPAPAAAEPAAKNEKRSRIVSALKKKSAK